MVPGEPRKKINSNWKTKRGLLEKITFQPGLERPGAVAFLWAEVERVSGRRWELGKKPGHDQ